MRAMSHIDVPMALATSRCGALGREIVPMPYDAQQRGHGVGRWRCEATRLRWIKAPALNGEIAPSHHNAAKRSQCVSKRGVARPI